MTRLGDRNEGGEAPKRYWNIWGPHAIVRRSVILAAIKSLRPRQWIKNAAVGIPLVFALKLSDTSSLLHAAGAILLFCAVSSSVYIINDIIDVDRDRAHPKKCKRPIAAGDLSIPAAKSLVGLMLPAALGLAILLHPFFAAALASYFALNLIYGFWTKQIPYLDVVSIALGFVLRVLGGALVIEVEPSQWLLACTALLSMFLGFGKRAHELGGGSTESERERVLTQRPVLQSYSAKIVRAALYLLALATVGTYAAYTQSDHVQQLFGDAPLMYTLPFAILGIFRFIHLTLNRPDAESPTDEMLRDPLFLLNFVCGVAVTTAVLYGWL